MRLTKRSLRASALSLALFALIGVWGFRSGAAHTAGPRRVASAEPDRIRLAASYGRLPLTFEVNRGQTDARVKFLARGQGYTLFLTGNEAVLSLQKVAGVGPTFRSARAGVAADAGLKPGAAASVEKPTTDNGPRTADSVLRMRLVGANPSPKAEGLEQLPGKSNYFIGNDPTKWRTNVPNYARVQYAGVYPGVDLEYYGHQRQLEYDFVVRPGADPSAIALEVGAPTVAPVSSPAAAMRTSPLQIDADGNLIVLTDGGDVRFHKPVVYQPAVAPVSSPAGLSLVTRHSSLVEGHYVLTASNQVRFALGPYDHTRPLVIDPVLAYSTYLGGSDSDYANGIAVDSAHNAYVTGATSSSKFPTKNPLQTANAGGADAFVTKLNPTGSALVYSTYLGGSGDDFGSSIALDSAGDAYVAGLTSSANFPTVTPFQAANAGGQDVFVTKLSPTGGALLYSTYLGGGGDDVARSIALDSALNAYVTGRTHSTNFPTKNPFQAANAGGTFDAFVTKLSPTGSALVYSTYLGGGGNDSGNGIAVDSAGDAYVTGYTDSTSFPTKNPLQAANAGSIDAFVTKLSSTGGALVYSTYLGGSGNDGGEGIALDSARNAYVTGDTSSTNFPTVNPFQAANAGGADAFVTKLNATGSALVYSTYLGGGGDEIAYSIAVDSAHNAYVTGYTASTNFPTQNPFQAANAGGFSDVFVSKLSPTGSALFYSSYLGGSDFDQANGIAVDSAHNAYVTGYTASTNFPTKNPFQGANAGGTYDAFVTKIVLAADLQITNSAAASVTSGSTLTYTIVVNNLGPDTATVVKIKDTTPVGTTFNGVSVSTGSCTAPAPGATGTVTCTALSLALAGSITETLTLNVTAASGSTITDTATASSMTFDPNKANNTKTVKTSVTAPPSACAGATSEQVFAASMHGCGGAVSFASRASLVAAGWHVCSSAEWVAKNGGATPTKNYWTSDTLFYITGGTTNNCEVSTIPGSSCGTGSSMLVCVPGAFPLTGCGLNSTSPNEFFGGCPTTNTAGALACQ